MSKAYIEFLKNKVQLTTGGGLKPGPMHPSLFPHQRDCVDWALRRGKALIAAKFGMGKSRMQIELMRQVHEQTGRKVLVICPLGVRHQFIYEDGPAMGVSFTYIGSDEAGMDAPTPYLITNYERVRDGQISEGFLQSEISGICLDEGAILGNLGTKTQQEFSRILSAIPYRWVATATPAPNDYRQLIYFADFLDAMDAGQSLAQPLDAKVLTPNGWKEMGNIKVGDEVIAVDGTPATVLGVYPQGVKPIYKASFSDGSSTECTEEHLWLTRTQYERNNERRYRQRNGTGNDGSRNNSFATIKTTRQLMDTLHSIEGGPNHDIPLVCKVQFKNRKVHVDPYLMGVLLGDGHIRQTSVNFCSVDSYIVEGVKEIAANHNLVVKKSDGIRADGRAIIDYRISNGRGKGHGGGSGNHTNPLLNGLRLYGLLDKRSWNKYVPQDYLFNSADVRLAVLQGLMDTDGTIDQANRTISFLSTSEQLANNVVFLVRSLGGIATITSRFPHHSIGVVAGRTVKGRRKQFKVTINLPAEINPFRLPRKANLVVPKTKYVPKRYITSIELVSEKRAQCIAIEHPSHLYVTDDFIVTHNTRWFGRNPDKAGDLQLLSHMEREFWLWIASWALFVDTPSDLGYSDDGYVMPELEIRFHRIAADHIAAQALTDQFGQHFLFADTAAGVQQAMKEKRNSLEDRIAKVAEIVATDPDGHFVIWHDLEDERKAICKAVPAAKAVYGSQETDEAERLVLDFTHGRFPILAAKPQMFGAGANFQKYCHRAIYAGVGFKFRDFIQSLHRLQRYGQMQTVIVDIIHTDAEDHVVDVLMRKWRQHDEMVAKMRAIIKEYGLTNEALSAQMQRTLGVKRQTAKGAWFTSINNDCVIETMAMADNSVDEIVTSIPFGNHYEYVASLNDFGHNQADADFWTQMDFLIPELLRVLKPGRMACIHVKDRLLYGHQTPHGMMEVDYFTHDCARAFRKHGFVNYGEIFIPTDVVRENNSTNRLGWSECCKDGSKMGVGLSEKVLLFRKPQTDKTRSYADEPVRKDKKDYSRGRWQIDAHSLWRSNGTGVEDVAHVTPADDPSLLTGMDGSQIYNWYKAFSVDAPYDYHQHVAFNEALGDRLPAKFMLMPPQAPGEYEETVWTDVLFMRTLNMNQARRRVEKHICPLPLDIVERLIVRYSNPGELIFDPFAGLHTVPYMAVELGRRGLATELNSLYWENGVKYCHEAEVKRATPRLFEEPAHATV